MEGEEREDAVDVGGEDGNWTVESVRRMSERIEEDGVVGGEAGGVEWSAEVLKAAVDFEEGVRKRRGGGGKGEEEGIVSVCSLSRKEKRLLGLETMVNDGRPQAQSPPEFPHSARDEPTQPIPRVGSRAPTG